MKLKSLLSRTKSPPNGVDFAVHAPVDSPEANATQAIRLFCEAPIQQDNNGDESHVLHLPVIVEAAESSPGAAAVAAQQIRKYLGREWSPKPVAQNHAIMLVRILCDNPGRSFTRNFDKQFVSTVKELLRSSKNSHTQQSLRETLDSLEVNKSWDEGLQGLLQMWRKEKSSQASLSNSASRSVAPPVVQPTPYQNVYNDAPPENGFMNGSGQAGAQSRPSRNQLPPPVELASRIEEARNTAKILLQLVQSTPMEEVLHSELIKEFGERCQSAQKSMQTYVNCDNPAPDDDTMQTLIETNEQLSVAGSRYHRAVLTARRALGASPQHHLDPMRNGGPVYGSPPAPAPQQSLPPLPSQQQFAQDESAFPQQRQYNPRYSSYQSALEPPQNSVNSIGQGFASPQVQPPTRQSLAVPYDQHQNPFNDPVQRDVSPARLETTNRVSGGYDYQRQAPVQQPQRTSQAFNIIPDPSYTYAQNGRRDTAYLENAYSSTTSPVSEPSPTPQPAQLRNYAQHEYVSPQLTPQQRPGPGPWHNSGVTPSYIHRQSSALNGLTMHGAQTEDDEGSEAVEIDGHSEVGRRDRDGDRSASTATSSTFTISPVETRTAQQQHIKRVSVDIAGTGGLRDSGSRRYKR